MITTKQPNNQLQAGQQHARALNQICLLHFPKANIAQLAQKACNIASSGVCI
jgi:hypothetical protein